MRDWRILAREMEFPTDKMMHGDGVEEDSGLSKDWRRVLCLQSFILRPR